MDPSTSIVIMYDSIWIKIFILMFGVFTILHSCTCERNPGKVNDTKKEYCSFFYNRRPKPQPDLKKCTWYKENSCCTQMEVEAVFGNVKPLANSSEICQIYTDYLMCYICAPNQNIFYKNGVLTVCDQLCDAWFSACSSAKLKGYAIGSLYKNGREFCLGQGFKTDTRINETCFFAEPSRVTVTTSVSFRQNCLSLQSMDPNVGRVLKTFGLDKVYKSMLIVCSILNNYLDYTKD